MIGSAIRELSVARKTSLLGAAFVEKTLQIWDLASATKLSEFPTIFDFGGANLALHPEGRLVVAGKCAKTGKLAAYDVPSGSQLWLRKPLVYPSGLHFDETGATFWCSVRSGSVEQIDAFTGRTLTKMEGIDEYFPGPGPWSLLVPKLGSIYLVTGPEGFRFDKLSFAVLDVCFGPESLYLTESGGPVRCISYNGGHEQWRLLPPPDAHVLKLHRSVRTGKVYGVLDHYKEGLYRHLIQFDPDTGKQEKVCDLVRSSAVAFVESQEQLVTSKGDIIDLATGRTLKHLDFPQMEYKPFRWPESLAAET